MHGVICPSGPCADEAGTESAFWDHQQSCGLVNFQGTWITREEFLGGSGGELQEADKFRVLSRNLENAINEEDRRNLRRRWIFVSVCCLFLGFVAGAILL